MKMLKAQASSFLPFVFFVHLWSHWSHACLFGTGFGVSFCAFAATRSTCLIHIDLFGYK